MAQILWLLERAPDRTLRSEDIWLQIPAYDEGRPSGRRLYRHDIRNLVERGLIDSGEQTVSIGNREAVRLRFIGKPKDWHLSAAEHAQIRRARMLLSDVDPVPVTDGSPGRGGSAFDTLTTAVRVLEEHGDEMTLDELACELRRTPRDILDALKQGWLLDAGPDAESVLGDLDIRCDNEDADIKPSTADPKRVWVSVIRPYGRATLIDTGLAALGRFAYTRNETAERLALIDRALSEHADELDLESLRRAQVKLRGWLGHLDRHDP